MQASSVLHKFAARGREELVKRAENVIVSSKEHFIPLNDDIHEDAKMDLVGKHDSLRKLLAQSPIDDTQLLLAVEDLELVSSHAILAETTKLTLSRMTAEMDIMIRERDIGNLT